MSDEAEARKALAKESRNLLDEHAFSAAIIALRRRWFDQLMTTTKIEQQFELVAMLKALEGIPQQLNIFVNDQKMAEQRNARRA